MRKPSNDFARVSDAQRAALEGLRTYAERLEEKRMVALTNHDLAWEAERRRFQPKLQHEFHFGRITPRLTQREYRKLSAEFAARRRTIEDRYTAKRKELERVKDLVLDRFNERAQQPVKSKGPQRSPRVRSGGRER
ncbi:hypothetical protein E0K89_005340 [Aquicoccus sp. SCR17]|nr:hypothetical protein [Carideicomes alvinocaridis]